MSTSTGISGSKNVFYEDKRDEIVSSFRTQLHKAGFSVQDEEIGKILDKRHKKVVRRNKTTPKEQCLSDSDIELVKQHRLLKKRVRSLCNELVVKRESSAVKIQETGRSYQQSVHEAMLQKKQKLEERINACKSTTVQASSPAEFHVNNETDESFEKISQNWEKIQRISKAVGDLQSIPPTTDEEQLDDSCDIQHVGRETVVKASNDNENDSLPLDEDYLPLSFDKDHEIIPNNAKVTDT